MTNHADNCQQMANLGYELLAPIAEPVLQSPAFQRLGGISFLGILSPSYREFLPADSVAMRRMVPGVTDGTRQDHSLGVASIILHVVRQLSLGEVAARYAVCWALVHDIATWPLSHTCERGFSSLLNVSSRQLRHKMVSGSPDLPMEYNLTDSLHKCGVDRGKLLCLFDRSKNSLDDQLGLVWQLIHSPLTPDTLEGILRTGTVFGIGVPSPETVYTGLDIDLFGLRVNSQHSAEIISFWRRKSLLYRRFINNRKIVELESALSLVVLHEFNGLTLGESLFLSEAEVVGRLRQYIGDLQADEVYKYKDPAEYIVPKHSRTLKGDLSLGELSSVLQRRYGNGQA